MEVVGQLFDFKSLLGKYLNKEKNLLSSYSFVNIFAWQNFFDFEFKLIKGNLCVFAENRIGRFLYLPPLGDAVDKKVIEECFEYMDEVNGGSGVTRIENVGQQRFNLFPEGRFKRVKKGYEYLYRREEIASLKGKKLHEIISHGSSRLASVPSAGAGTFFKI